MGIIIIIIMTHYPGGPVWALALGLHVGCGLLRAGSGVVRIGVSVQTQWLYVGGPTDKCLDGAWVENHPECSKPSGSTRIAVTEGLTSYVWLEEARVTGQLGKPTEPRYFGVYVMFSRLWNRRVTKDGAPLNVQGGAK